ncbi:MAG: efflux RND transporter permease subunit [Nocardioidaceae bacterium]
MATALYRLGRWCATHPWRVIGTWILVAVMVGAGAGTLGKPLTTQVSIPGSDFQRVIDELGQKIPEADGGMGTVVFRSERGSFTPSEEKAVADVLEQWRALPHVKSAQDPFEAQRSLDQGGVRLEAAKARLDRAQAKVDQGRDRLDAAQAQLAFGRRMLASMVAADPQDPQAPALRARLDSGAARLAKAERRLGAGEAQLAEGWAQYDAGVTQRTMLDGFRFVTEDGRYAVAQIQFDTNTQSLPSEVRERIPEIGDELADAGVHVDYSVEITQDVSVVGPGEIAGLILAAIVLVVMLGTLVAAGLPVTVALVGVGVGLGGAMTATLFFRMNTMAPSLALMLGLAVGIDYSLFIVNRHRTRLLHGTDVAESVGRAIGTAGNAVIFAASTVIIALAALVVSGIPILAQLGLVAAATVAVTVVVAITLTPAALGLMGTRVASRRAWRAAGFGVPGDTSTWQQPEVPVPSDHEHEDQEDEEEHGGWYLSLVTRRPWATVIGVVLTAALLSLPALDLRLGLADGNSEPEGSTAYATYSTVAREFGPGVNGPVVAVVTLPDGSTSRDAADARVEIGRRLADLEGVRSVVPFGESKDHSTLAFQLVLTTGPSEESTVDTVQWIKDRSRMIGDVTGTRIEVTGQTVANIEISQRLAGVLPLYLALVVGLSLVILMVVFRSVIVPLVATGGFLLSVAVSFGATVAVYQWGWLGSLFAVSHPGAILSFMPILLIGVLFGLAMDYQMFLVSGMREAWAHGEDPRAAVRTGFVHGAKVVTAAAVIMASVFGGFVFAEMTMIRAVGFGLAVGVLFDAVVVRMTLTPAVMHLLGERAWWMPSGLDRLTPDIDLEGTRLTAHLVRTADGT